MCETNNRRIETLLFPLGLCWKWKKTLMVSALFCLASLT